MRPVFLVWLVARLILPTPPASADTTTLPPSFHPNRRAAYSCASQGARAYLRLGEDDLAVETAVLAAAEEDEGRVLKSTTLIECKRVLAEVAAKRP